MNSRSWNSVAGIMLLIGGLIGHVLAAIAIGGTSLAYRDHLLGFFALTVASAVLLFALSLRFWKGRHDITVLIVGIVQALLGVFAYVTRYSVHG